MSMNVKNNMIMMSAYLDEKTLAARSHLMDENQ